MPIIAYTSPLCHRQRLDDQIRNKRKREEAGNADQPDQKKKCCKADTPTVWKLTIDYTYNPDGNHESGWTTNHLFATKTRAMEWGSARIAKLVLEGENLDDIDKSSMEDEEAEEYERCERECKNELDEALKIENVETRFLKVQRLCKWISGARESAVGDGSTYEYSIELSEHGVL